MVLPAALVAGQPDLPENTDTIPLTCQETAHLLATIAAAHSADQVFGVGDSSGCRKCACAR
jgi:hypothetical protein